MAGNRVAWNEIECFVICVWVIASRKNENGKEAQVIFDSVSDLLILSKWPRNLYEI